MPKCLAILPSFPGTKPICTVGFFFFFPLVNCSATALSHDGGYRSTHTHTESRLATTAAMTSLSAFVARCS